MKARRFLAGTFSQAVRVDVQGDAAVIWGKERRKERCRCAVLPTWVSVVRSTGQHSDITYRVLRLTSPPTGVTSLLYLPAKCRFACLLCKSFHCRGRAGSHRFRESPPHWPALTHATEHPPWRLLLRARGCCRHQSCKRVWQVGHMVTSERKKRLSGAVEYSLGCFGLRMEHLSSGTTSLSALLKSLPHVMGRYHCTNGFFPQP